MTRSLGAKLLVMMRLGVLGNALCLSEPVMNSCGQELVPERAKSVPRG